MEKFTLLGADDPYIYKAGEVNRIVLTTAMLLVRRSWVVALF